MTTTYDHYYQTENYFGAPYPALMAFFAEQPTAASILDLGCGQGRNAIALAQLGFAVTGIDSSKVGIEQMARMAQDRQLNVEGIVADIHAFDAIHTFDFVLLDSMFHFAKKDKEREVQLLRKIITDMKSDALLVVCIQDVGSKVEMLLSVIQSTEVMDVLDEQSFVYVFKEESTGHTSESPYRMIIGRKQA